VIRGLKSGLVGAFLLATAGGCASQFVKGVADFQQCSDDKAAAPWVSPAEGGDRLAQYHAGVQREQGLGGTPRNLTEAAAWYSLSAKGGYTPAMVSLARIQRQFAFEEEALGWLNLAARQGNEAAVNELRRWGKPVPPADLLQTDLANAEPTQQEPTNAVPAALPPGAGVAAAGHDQAGATRAVDILWSFFQETPDQRSQSRVPTTAAEDHSEYRGTSGATDENDSSRPADRLGHGTDVQTGLRDASMPILDAPSIAEWIMGLVEFGGDEGER